MINAQLKELARTKGKILGGCHELAQQLSKDPSLQEGGVKVPIAVISNFTVQGLAECIKTHGLLFDLCVDVYEGAYGQWQQEILGESLYAHAPKVIFLMVDCLGPEQAIHYIHFDQQPSAGVWIEDQMNNLYGMIELLKQKTKAKIVVANNIQPAYTLMGNTDQKLAAGIRESVARANLSLLERFRADQQVWIFDLDNWLGHIGKRGALYDKYYYLGDLHISPSLFPDLAGELVSFLIPSAGKGKKCLVLDLDNTLWGGIIGEDGLEGIALGPTGNGLPYYLFQKTILGLHKRGILLAINSKNNENDVLEVLRKHPHMLIREEHIAAMKINWQHKADNIKEIAQELNIGIDSLVFVDDDPSQRAFMRGFVPEVEVLELPKDSTLYRETLLQYKGFEIEGFTEEDRKRGALYYADRQRSNAVKDVKNLDDILRTLKIKLKIAPLNQLTMPRAVQLTQKTNQFNLTTRRYNKEDIDALVVSGGGAWTLDISDVYGDYGMTGLIIVEKKLEHWYIDTLLMSCRILGKMIEHQFVGHVLGVLQSMAPMNVVAEYISTAKNAQTENFYTSTGFSKMENTDARHLFIIDLQKYTFTPSTLMELYYE